MRMMLPFPAFAALFLTSILLTPSAAADSCPPDDCLPVVPFPNVKYLSGLVDFESFGAVVAIQDGIARTALTLQMSNPGTTATEAIVNIPLPDGAALLAFNLTIGENLIEGRVTEKQQAKQEYNQAQQEGRDAALLEQADKRLVRLSINVGPGEDRVLRASYVEVVPLAAGARVYRLPLTQLDPVPADVQLYVDVQDSLGVEDLRAPREDLTFVDLRGVASITDGNPLEDLVVVWEPAGAIQSRLIAASNPAAGPTEYLATFCLSGLPLGRDVVFVLDQSGSMGGLKIVEAREALSATLATLTPADRFSVVLFNSGVDPFESKLISGSAAHVKDHQTQVAAITAGGGTNLDGGLQEGLAQLASATGTGRLPMLVLFSDGLPSSGVTDHQEIIKRAKAANTRHAPIVVVPIGLDADYTFLADLALNSGGTYVDVGTPTDATSHHLTRLAEILAHPVMAAPRLTVDGIDVELLLPRVLPPVFEEDCHDIRLRGDATDDITLTLDGTGATGPMHATATFKLQDIAVEPAVRSLWGQAFVADLLSQERADPDNDKLHDQVVDAAILFRQLSPHTAWILTDERAQQESASDEQASTSAASCSAQAQPSGAHSAYDMAASASTRQAVSAPGGTGASNAQSTGQSAQDAAFDKSAKTPAPGAVLVLFGIACALLVSLRRIR